MPPTGDQFISSELFVLAALEDKGDLGRMLKEAGVTKHGAEKAIESLRGGSWSDCESLRG